MPEQSQKNLEMAESFLKRASNKLGEAKEKQVLKELFKTMLHKLMGGEIRLKEVVI